MILKKINPEELQPGKKYLVEMEFKNDKRNSNFALVFLDVMATRNLLPAEQPIYTHEPSIQRTAELTDDRELKMLVSVANDIFCASNNPKYTVKDAAVDAFDLINACKNELNKKA